jgi:two-component system, cell cycle response regulator DivK
VTQLHALVIDDNAQNVQVLVQLLAKQNVQATQITNPARLAEVLPSLEAVDVVFLDLEMPRLDGFAVKELLRTQLGNIPIIACTVHLNEMSHTRQLGFDGFLGKPLNRARFPNQLERILQRQPVWESE